MEFGIAYVPTYIFVYNNVRQTDPKMHMIGHSESEYSTLDSHTGEEMAVLSV